MGSEFAQDCKMQAQFCDFDLISMSGMLQFKSDILGEGTVLAIAACVVS